MPTERPISVAAVDAEAPDNRRLRIGGFVPFSTTDYPDQLAAVVFCQGCPWRCVYCHNPHLIPAGAPGKYTWSDLLRFLSERRGLLDAVVFSGGEPTLQSALPDAMRQVRSMGFRIGLHTGGMYPKRLAEILPLLDWIGLDVKAPQAAYDRITSVAGSGRAVFESLAQVIASGVNYELRCTWHPDLLSVADLENMTDQLARTDADRLVIQVYRAIGDVGAPAPIDADDMKQADFSYPAKRLQQFTVRE